MKNKIIKLLLETAPNHRTRTIQKNKLKFWFDENFPNVPLNIAISCLLSGNNPYCVVCNTPVKFLGKTTCSISCRSLLAKNNSEQIVNKRKLTNLEKYGVSNAMQLDSSKQKRINTMIEKYGGKVSDKTRLLSSKRSSELNTKGRETLKSKYGITNPGQLPTHREKSKKTLIQNFNSDSYFKSEEFFNISLEKRYKKWNVIFPNSVELLDISTPKDKLTVFENPNLLLKFKCNVCNNVEELPTETAKWRTKQTGTPCLCCSGINQGSVKQQELYDFVVSLGVFAQQNFILNNKKEIDVFCPAFNIGFEFNGLFWHNDLRINKTYHADKTIAAHKQNIKLIHIFEDEWDYKKDIVKSRIRNLLKLNLHKIYARRCTISTVNRIEEKAFLENNHIQGYARSTVAYGLYFENQLVSLMSFGNLNPAKGYRKEIGHYELLRFCSITNTSVVGSANKLLSKFIKDQQPIKIISFADKRWSTGELYQTLNFSQNKDTALNYWYINLKNGTRIYRYQLRKNKSDDQSISEYENRLKQGYLRIWDCGSTKWVWTAS